VKLGVLAVGVGIQPGGKGSTVSTAGGKYRGAVLGGIAVQPGGKGTGGESVPGMNEVSTGVDSGSVDSRRESVLGSRSGVAG
jgi:hypothetical protein